MTHLTWYSVVVMTFHTAVDVAWLAFIVLAARAVRGTSYHIHRRWLVPLIVNSSLDLVFRLLNNATDLHFIPDVRAVYALAYALLYIGEVSGLYGVFLLWQTLRRTASERSGSRLVTVPHQEGVWPPPPTGTA